ISSTRRSSGRLLDIEREQDRTWYASEKMVGATLYVDLFAGDFNGLRERIPYLQELGVTYLHLMPVFRTPATNSDGGYAVSSYRETNPKLGTIDDLRELATEFRRAGISLVLDFIFNHTSNEHDWALAARSGDERYRDYYRVFPDRTVPDQYEATLREIFPEQSPGNFTWDSDLQGYVWTTFYSFQWDLNYENPEVLTAMMGEMLFLANVGVEVLRLDAVAFVWKETGTPSESLPQAHMIVQALNALVNVAAPAMIFKSEAIVHPDDVVSYIDADESPISYNPTMMAMIWDALATRRADVLSYAMQKRYALPEDCVWVNYVRVHDDIGWSMADGDLAQFGINGFDHRQFLNRFYTGRFDGSFARGVGFGYNEVTQDLRIAGTAASLTGLEAALETDDAGMIQDAINRLLMIHSIILSTGGIPLLYIGDEIATLNDYSYEDDPQKALDSRWVHRSEFNLERAEARDDASTIQGAVFLRLKHMIDVRKNTRLLGGVQVAFFDSGNAHVLAYVRSRTILCLHNFSERPQQLSRDIIATHWTRRGHVTNTATGETVHIGDTIDMPPYAYMWLV
ncbi:MAG: amylosucrase, partial [Chloroflexota bacterium]